MDFPRGRGDQKTKHGISGGWGEYGETLWNGKSWGVGGSNWKNPPWGGGYGYVLEPHIVNLTFHFKTYMLLSKLN